MKNTSNAFELNYTNASKYSEVRWDPIWHQNLILLRILTAWGSFSNRISAAWLDA